MKLAILKETKTPVDRRVALTPAQCRLLSDRFPDIEVSVQPDSNRCFRDHEYERQGIRISENLSDCDFLLGVKEVKPEYLLPGKTYMFFSHTAKKQRYNLELLRSAIRKKIKLIDYEYLTYQSKARIVAFGRWAGIVGAYNTLRAYGNRSGEFELLPAWKCRDMKDLMKQLSVIKISRQKIVITGGGRVAGGAVEVLEALGLPRISPGDFLAEHTREGYTQLDPQYYVRHRDKKEFDLEHFFSFPGEYENNFIPYTRSADIFIACHFWDPRSPVLMTRKDMQDEAFRIRIIGDVSCDIDGPIPSTLRASTIAEPLYGYDPESGRETDPFKKGAITVMSVDNLPGELPRDASEDFGNKLLSDVIPSLVGQGDPLIVQRASITEDGSLTGYFSYLQDYVDGKE